MDNEIWSLLLVTGASVLNILLTYFLSRRRIGPEIRKMEAERFDSMANASESSLQAALISNNLLMQRIEELRRHKAKLLKYIEMLEADRARYGLPPLLMPDTDELLKGKNE